MPPTAHVFRAGRLVRAEGPALEDAAVVASGGRILRVGPWSRLRPHVGPGDAVEHVPDGILVPGFVNAHTHLGLTDMAGRFRPTSNFTAWIGRLTARLALRSEAAAREAVRQGAARAADAATTAGADLAHDAGPAEALAGGSARWTVFAELFRFGETGLARLAAAVAALEALARATGLRVGLAPHAPYTAGPEVFLAARREADARGWPVSTHLHETLDEIAFAERGEGTLAAWMRRLRILPAGWRPPGVSPIRMLAEAGFFRGPVLAAHANYLADGDIAVLARSGSSVAFCPRSHAFFRHEDHPWRRLLAAGVNVCLGTDSLASCPSLSVLDEARFLFGREPGADPRLLLEMATVRGARALGLDGEVGDVRPGLAAELAVIEPGGPARDVSEALLAGPIRALRALRPR